MNWHGFIYWLIVSAIVIAAAVKASKES